MSERDRGGSGPGGRSGSGGSRGSGGRGGRGGRGAGPGGGAGRGARAGSARPPFKGRPFKRRDADDAGSTQAGERSGPRAPRRPAAGGPDSRERAARPPFKRGPFQKRREEAAGAPGSARSPFKGKPFPRRGEEVGGPAGGERRGPHSPRRTERGPDSRERGARPPFKDRPFQRRRDEEGRPPSGERQGPGAPRRSAGGPVSRGGGARPPFKGKPSFPRRSEGEGGSPGGEQRRPFRPRRPEGSVEPRERGARPPFPRKPFAGRGAEGAERPGGGRRGARKPDRPAVYRSHEGAPATVERGSRPPLGGEAGRSRGAGASTPQARTHRPPVAPDLLPPILAEDAPVGVRLIEVEEVELTIEKLIAGGDGLARLDGVPIFVPRTAPGDRVRARLVVRRPDFGRAEVIEVLTAGPGAARAALSALLRVRRLRPPAPRRAPPAPLQGRGRGRDAAPAREDPAAAALRGAGRRGVGLPHPRPDPHRAGRRRLPGRLSRARLEAAGADRGLSGARSRVSRRRPSALGRRLGARSAGPHRPRDRRRRSRRRGAGGRRPRRGRAAAPGGGLRAMPTTPAASSRGIRACSTRWSTAWSATARGELAFDLYGGVGLFALPLATRYARVVTVEADRIASRYARKNARTAQLDGVEAVSPVGRHLDRRGPARRRRPRAGRSAAAGPVGRACARRARRTTAAPADLRLLSRRGARARPGGARPRPRGGIAGLRRSLPADRAPGDRRPARPPRPNGGSGRPAAELGEWP